MVEVMVRDVSILFLYSSKSFLLIITSFFCLLSESTVTGAGATGFAEGIFSLLKGGYVSKTFKNLRISPTTL